MFYIGDRFPRWKNDLLVSSLAAQELRRLRIEGGRVTKQEVLFKGIGRIRDVVVGPDGLVYVAFNVPDGIARLVPAPVGRAGERAGRRAGDEQTEKGNEEQGQGVLGRSFGGLSAPRAPACIRTT